MMSARVLTRIVRKAFPAPKRIGSGLVIKRSFVTSFPNHGKGCGASRKPTVKKHKAKSSCQQNVCPKPKNKPPCLKPPCPIPVPNCPMKDPCWHCPYTPPPCPKEVHRCCPKPPCVPNPKEFKLACCEKSQDPCNKECDTCEKKPECCPCDPCQTAKNECCPADLQQKHLCSRPPPKKVLKRCERPGACDDPCCPRKPCCPDPCDKCKDPCAKPCDERCPRPEIPDVCSELGIICGPDKECEFKQHEPCPGECDRKHRDKKKRQPQPPPCCLDLDPEWPPRREQCDANCLSPDPCNPCQQTCKEKRPFWDGL